MNTSPRVPPSAATQLSPETLYQTSSHVENGVGQRVYSVVSNGSDSDTKFVEEAKVPESRRYIRRWHAPLIGQQILGDRISRFSCVKQTIFMLALLLISVLVALLIYFNEHLRREVSYEKLQRAIEMQNLVASWTKSVAQPQDPSHYPTDFSRDITPKSIHSHNDYWRTIPLYEALAAGCTGIEADVWLTDNDLRVGHTQSSLTSARTLDSLYLNPLVSILSHQNPSLTQLNSTNATGWRGVFETSSSTSLTLLIDMKSDGADTLRIVLQQIEPLRSRGWLTYFNGSTVIPGPITIVGTGNTPFNLLNSNSTYRDVFFDAPLDQLSGANTSSNAKVYTNQNSYYASVSFADTIGKLQHGIFSQQQLDRIRAQIGAASARGLKARYWDAPAWPISVRDEVWDVLEKEGVGMLNADDVNAASSQNW